ncbi:MAG: hypothetical protein WA655_06360 [Candidatus Korobacteraceae bacterium]
MDVKAILLIGGRETGETVGARPETVNGIPAACLDVLGLPVLERILQRLHRFGASATTVIGEIPAEIEPLAKHAPLWRHSCAVRAAGEELWKSVNDAFQKCALDGADLVLALRLGAYAEVDYEELIQHHLDHRCAVTNAVDAEGASLDLFVLNASGRADAATLFESHLQRVRRECVPFRVTGYVNRLRNAADLRRLATDGLLRANSLCPVGKEIKPGVWVGTKAHIHRHARLVAPAFIGAHAKIRAAALITRGTVVERQAEVDCGTVVENSTVLPFTYVGAGLDVMHSVIGFRRLHHLVRNVEVEISDGKFVGMSALRAVSRFAGSTAALFTVLPKRIFRGVFTKPDRESAACDPESLGQPSVALETSVITNPGSGSEASEFPSSLAVARRYGEQ